MIQSIHMYSDDNIIVMHSDVVGPSQRPISYALVMYSDVIGLYQRRDGTVLLKYSDVCTNWQTNMWIYIPGILKSLNVCNESIYSSLLVSKLQPFRK